MPESNRITSPPTTKPTPPPKPPAAPKQSAIPKSNTVLETLEVIRTLSGQLNTITDSAARTIQHVETFLNEVCSVGVTAYTCYEHSGPELAGTYLEYRRVGPRFRIAVVRANEHGEDIEVKAWSDCSRDDKLQSFQSLPTLLGELVDSLQVVLQDAQRTLAQVAETIAALPQK